MTPRFILVVEDDPVIRRGVVDALRFSGYEVMQTGDGRNGTAFVVEMPRA
jgi:two-component system alkaline phosphatase synthesis response regulator PhoP